MLRTLLLAVLVLSSSGCPDVADLAQVSFTRVTCNSRSTCEVGVTAWMRQHPLEYVLALDYQVQPHSIVITHGNFGATDDALPAGALRLTATPCASGECWKLRVADAPAARVPAVQAVSARRE